MYLGAHRSVVYHRPIDGYSDESGKTCTIMLVQWKVEIYANVMLPLALVSNKLNAGLPFFSTLFQWDKIATAFKCTFEETMPKLSVNFGNDISRDSHKNQYPGPICNFGFTASQYSDKC